MATQTEYVSCAETAKLARAALKAAFPLVKFGVRSHVYSGGASINIAWQDGPTEKAVEQIASRFEGASFDGTIDMQCDHYHWRLPDGRIIYGDTQGTEGSRGMIPATTVPRPIQGQRIKFMADHIFCDRRYSADLLAKAVAQTVCRYGCPAPQIVPDTGYGASLHHDYRDVNGSRYDAADLAMQIAHELAA